MQAQRLQDDCGKEGEDEIIAELTERFRHRARFFAYRIERRFGLDSQWRDDLISSGYWGLYKALANRRVDAHERELSAYISRRVEGAVIDEARRILSRLSNSVDRDGGEVGSEEIVEWGACDWDFGRAPLDPEHLADRAFRWCQIEAAVESLDDDQRKLLWAYAEGHSLAEIARGHGESAAKLQASMTRIARKVRARSPELRRVLRNEL